MASNKLEDRMLKFGELTMSVLAGYGIFTALSVAKARRQQATPLRAEVTAIPPTSPMVQDVTSEGVRVDVSTAPEVVDAVIEDDAPAMARSPKRRSSRAR